MARGGFGPGGGLCPPQMSKLFPLRDSETCHGAAHWQEDGVGEDQGQGPLSIILSLQHCLIPAAQSVSLMDIPGVGGLAASPGECWEGKGGRFEMHSRK